jgi:general secretion pathway protein G
MRSTHLLSRFAKANLDRPPPLPPGEGRGEGTRIDLSRPGEGRGEGTRIDLARPGARRREESRGFTLIELMVVLVLIAILLTIAVPRYFGTVDKGKLSVQRQNIAAIRDAIDKYYGDQGKYPDTLQDLVDKRYLREIPVDPLTEHRDWVTVPPADASLTGIYDIQSVKAKAEGAANAP